MRPIQTLWRSFLTVGCSGGVAFFGLVPRTTHLFFSSFVVDFVVRAQALSFNHQQQQKGKVVRLAVRKYHPQHSKPSSREYTTRKAECSTLCIQIQGCHGDYNHYRSLALHSTPDRAVSLLTCDVLENLRAIYPKAAIMEGDLGENILVDFSSFK
jgi:MOSC domain-containing protein YiiM